MTVTKRLGSVGVDSGQLFIVDPCYLSSTDFHKLASGDGRASIRSESYHKVMTTTLGFDPETESGPASDDALHAGEVEQGVAFNTDIGDGDYSVYGVYSDTGHLLRVVVHIQGRTPK